MKRYILLLSVLFIQCSSEKYKEKLIGAWYSQEYNTTMSLVFSQDSFFINSSIKTRQKWDIDKTTIYLQNITDLEMDSLYKKGLKLNYKYYLSENNDTFRWRTKKDTINIIYKFIRIKNQFKHFQKALDFKFNLPKSKAKLIPVEDDSMNLHYYIGLVNDKLMIKNKTQFVKLVDDAFGDVIRLKFLLEKKEFKNSKIILLSYTLSVSFIWF